MRLLLLIFISVATLSATAQRITDKHLVNTISALSTIHELKPIEKLYLQTDKPHYVQGDTLHFKAYLINADYLTPALRSGLLYIELDDLEGKPMKRIMVPVENGLAWGDIALDSKDIPEGSYTLRAYTNWQRNFGEDYIFKKDISISATNGGALLVKAGFAQKGGKVESILQFTSLDGHVQALKDMQLKVMNGRKNLSKDKVSTGIDGTVNVNFVIPEQATIKDLAIKVQDVSKGITNAQELTIPVTINRIENTDLQFMPEGGNIIAGIKTKVGVKALAEDGRGTNITGTIIDSKQSEVAKFSTTHAGMGSFEFMPKANETYTAKINGITKTYNLPSINAAGTTLRLTQTTDSIQITVNATSLTTSTSPTSTYYLVGESRGVVCYAQTITLNSNNIQQIKTAAKDQFPTGIARFTLINAEHQPVNERQVFIDHQDNLNISIQTNKANYGIRDSVALAISVKDKNGKPVQGNFSLAVTDNSQVKTDSLSTNIISNLLLTSDLKGNIEDPNYYFINPKQKQAELDNLLLTQGWVGYDWTEVFHPKLPYTYKPQQEFTISGKVTNAFGKPMERSNIVLFANNPLMVKDTLSDSEGRFMFKGLLPIDTAIFKLQARNKNGKENNVKIDMDEVKPPVFNPSPLTMPWYLNTDSTLLTNSRLKTEQEKALSLYKGEGQVLKEVNIKAKKIIKGSKNLNGPGGADLVIDEEELAKANKLTLGELLMQKIKGFTERGRWANDPTRRTIPMTYVLNYKKLHFVFDGIDLEYFYPGQNINDRYFTIKKYLDYFTAEDITGIELMFSDKYNVNYGINMLKPPPFGQPPEYNVDAWLEITTRSKHGPFMQVVPGTYLYKTLPFTIAKQFYRPRYTANNREKGIGTDLRSTVHWEPNLTTDASGKATVSFFSTDKAAGYAVVVEGTDMDGQIGYGESEIKVH